MKPLRLKRKSFPTSGRFSSRRKSIQPEADQSHPNRTSSGVPILNLIQEPKRRSVEDAAPIDTEIPDWLKSADEDSRDESESILPDWTKTEKTSQAILSLENEETAEITPEEAPPTDESDLPSWLASLGQETTEIAPEEGTQPSAESDTQDWLASLDKARSCLRESVQYLCRKRHAGLACIIRQG